MYLLCVLVGLPLTFIGICAAGWLVAGVLTGITCIAKAVQGEAK